MCGLSLGPLIQPRSVHNNLPIRRQFDLRPIHGPRRRALEVNSFAVVATAVAGTFKFIFAGLPIGRASQMRTSRIDYE